MEKTIITKLKSLHSTPRKTRFVADVIRGLSVNEAEARLMLLSRRSAAPLLKLLKSAAQNAKHNFQLDSAKLFIKEIRVDQGSKFRRWTPRARGSTAIIEKKTSHVTLILEESKGAQPSRYTILEKPKKQSQEKSKTGKTKGKAVSEKELGDTTLHKHEEETKKVISGKKPSTFNRMFRRKSI